MSEFREQSHNSDFKLRIWRKNSEFRTKNGNLQRKSPRGVTSSLVISIVQCVKCEKKSYVGKILCIELEGNSCLLLTKAVMWVRNAIFAL